MLLVWLWLLAEPAAMRHASYSYAACHRELICMHSGIVNRNRSPGRGALPQFIQPLPGHATGRKYSSGCLRSTCTRSAGQAAARQIAAAPPVQGVNFRLLVRGVQPPAGGCAAARRALRCAPAHGCYLASKMNTIYKPPPHQPYVIVAGAVVYGRMVTGGACALRPSSAFPWRAALLLRGRGGVSVMGRWSLGAVVVTHVVRRSSAVSRPGSQQHLLCYLSEDPPLTCLSSLRRHRVHGAYEGPCVYPF
jgi:hypothetical protein